MKRTTAHKALQRAIEAAGGQAPLAAAIGVRQSHIWYWLRKSEFGVPAERVLDVERATGVSRNELRPDLFVGTVQRVQGFGEEDASFGDENAKTPPPRRSNHFSRFKHLRRANFATAEEIEEHIQALREEWSHR